MDLVVEDDVDVEIDIEFVQFGSFVVMYGVDGIVQDLCGFVYGGGGLDVVVFCIGVVGQYLVDGL